MTATTDYNQLWDFRRRVYAIYQQTRDSATSESSWNVWRDERDALFRTHPQSPIPSQDRSASARRPYRQGAPASGRERSDSASALLIPHMVREGRDALVEENTNRTFYFSFVESSLHTRKPRVDFSFADRKRDVAHS